MTESYGQAGPLQPGSGPDPRRQEAVRRVGRLLELADLLTPWAVRTVSSLRIPEAIASGSSTVDEIAAATSTDARALGTLLRFLAGREVLNEISPGQFGLGPLGETMAADLRLPLRMMLDVDGAQSRFGQAGAGLAHAVRTGQAAYPAVFHQPFWADLSADPALGRAFDELMAVSAMRWVPMVVGGWDWNSAQNVIDVGGGTADLLIALLQAYPALRAGLVEQPGVAERARGKLAEAGLAGRVDVRPGSFFDPLPPGGDVYVLAQILHDWPDHQAAEIMKRCREAIGPAGRVLLVERVLDDPQPDPSHAGMDLLMLMLFGAAERRRAELEALAAAAGLRVSTARPLGLGVSLLECRAAEVPGPAAAKAGVRASLQQPASAVATSSRPGVFGADGPQAGSRPAPPPCPSGWRTGPPDYVGVGVHGAGVSWWSGLVAAHPAISSTGTELRYFRPHWDREFGDQEIDLYHQHFPRPAGTIAGEWNPYYIHDWWTAPRLRRAAPDVRLLVLLRDPLARLEADLADHLTCRPKASARVLNEAAERGRYAAQLSSLTQHFPPEQVLVLQCERCLADPAGQLERTFRFLGLESSPGPALDTRPGPALDSSPGPADVPGPPAGRLPEDLRDALVAAYRRDARTLADEWPGIDLELWPSVR